MTTNDWVTVEFLWTDTVHSELGYSSYLGGSEEDDGNAIAPDGFNGVWVAGHTSSTDFPVTDSAHQSAYGGGDMDAFISHISSTGVLISSTYLGGSDYDIINGLAPDGYGGIWAVGYTLSTDFPVTEGAYQNTFRGGTDAIICHFSSTGSLLYSTYLGGSYSEDGWDLTSDGSGGVWIVGETSSTDFPVTEGAYQTIARGTGDAFVSHISSTGSLLSSTYLGGSYWDKGYATASDDSGGVWIGGWTESTNFPVLNAYQGTYGYGSGDAFITHFSSAGSLLSSSYLGGAGYDMGNALAPDASGGVWAAGYWDAGVFVFHFSSTGSVLSDTFLSGSGIDAGWALASDGSGGIWVAGETESTDFPVLNAYQSSKAGGVRDAFVSHLSSTGVLRSSTYFGGNDNDVGWALATDGSGGVWLTGATNSTDLPVTDDAYQSSKFGWNSDVFLTNFFEMGYGPTITSISPTTITAGSDGFTIEVTGTNFVNGAKVLFDGEERLTVFFSSTKLTATILKEDIAVAGIHKVKVVNPDISESNEENLEVISSLPVNLILYVHDTSITGPLIENVQIEGTDGTGQSFSGTTDTFGKTTITGNSGVWHFIASKPGYIESEWYNEIINSQTRHAYLLKQSEFPLYNAQSAVNYAHTWGGEKRNPQYHDYSYEGGDCANFVSQCLVAGGLTLDTYTDAWGSIVSCDSLNAWLKLKGYKSEEIYKTQTPSEPVWFSPGDIAIYGNADDKYKHAIIAVGYNTENFALCNGHTPDMINQRIAYLYQYNDWDRCTFYRLNMHNNITVTSPNGGENWTKGSTQTLRWNYTGNPGSTVSIEVVKGTAIKVIAQNISIGADGSGSFNFTFPYSTPLGSDYLVRITSTSNATCTDTSDAPFAIIPPITILSPNGGEEWQQGSTQTIRWHFTGDPGPLVKIEALRGNTVMAVITPGTPVGSGGSGSMNLTLPINTPLGTDYRIRISSPSNTTYSDTSDAPFKVVANASASISIVSPNGREDYLQGSSQTISWNYVGDPGSMVKIEALLGDKVLAVITPGTSIGSGGAGSYNLTFPYNTPLGSDYRIRITSTSNSAWTDMSDDSFGVSPAIELISPNGGENWVAGATYSITWTYSGYPGAAVKIEALRGESVLATIASSYPLGSDGEGSYNLTLPLNTPVGKDYRFRITSTSNPRCTDTSDSMFTISA